ncbi:MAG: T9SS type A sorting domain-containing protein [Sphingobacteriales bacterium]|nr:T9SS type A sorting domain-containing protein [Sphingobacteriales bacterium]
MRKILPLLLGSFIFTTAAFAQSDKFWSENKEDKTKIPTDKAVKRLSYPREYKLFNLNAASLRQELISVVDKKTAKQKTIITLPNASGSMEEFELYEASNFEPDLQARFPDIRAYSGRGITDKYATVKLSFSPEGVQTMIFRTESDNEFIEPYSSDHKVYAVYKSHREKGQLPWTCTTDDKQMAAGINSKIGGASTALASGTSTGQLKTMRLAQSCNGEYSNYFGAFSSADVAKVLAAYNATLTRCNGVYEKDLALHLNLIANTTAVIYYDPATDPYSTTLSQWNNQLQTTLTNVIGEANYDIGHMFGASGGGGNAGCIGCVCVNGSKGSGITSPADGIPQGDNFDIDYVVHEVGHQLGANHTFSMSNEGTGQQKEVGSGITIMGYAGITSQDVAPHSIDIFHETSIAQIQANLANKTCPVSFAMTANHAPSVAAVSNYTIPISTPFALTGSATDPENDPLTYCWEQNDNSSTTGTGSVASPAKTTGPNWLSFSPTVSGTRTFPRLSTILAGLNVTGPLPGGDAGANIEALSSVSRTLNFRLTVRDNNPYVAGSTIGQTAFTDAVVTVTSTAGPFAVTAPNTAVTWNAGSSATVTWSVNGTNAGSVNCATVNILLSTDGGQTFPTVLAAGTANDGTEIIAVPATQSTTCRIKVESVGNIFFDISNANFTIGAPPACADPTGLTNTTPTQTSTTVSWAAVSGALSYDVDYKINAASIWINVATATTATSVDLSGLTAGTVYNWRVRATCSGGTGNYVQANFTTASAPVTCPGVYDVSTNGTTSGAATIPLNTDVKGLINPSGDNDYYKFTITTGGTIIITLTTLPANYQLSLLNGSGSVIASSTSGGTNNETINTTVAAGTYYARVYPFKSNAFNASNCYTLRVQTGTAARLAGADAVQAQTKFSVYPNPANSAANLAFTSTVSGNAEITVVNQMGRVVLRKTIAASAGDNFRKLDVSSLVSGLYIIKVQNGADIQMTKLLINK